MADFQITVPGSGSFKVTAPDADTAYSSLMQHLGSANAAAPAAPAAPAAAAPAATPPAPVQQQQLGPTESWSPNDPEPATKPLPHLPANMQSMTAGPTPDQVNAQALDPTFVQNVLAKQPPSQQAAAQRILGENQGNTRGALETGVRKAVDDVGMGLPDVIEAKTGALPYDTARAIQTAANQRMDENHPVAAQVGHGVAALSMMGAPEALFSTPLRSAITSGVQSGVSAAAHTDGDWKETVKQALLGATAGGLTAGVLGPGKAPTARDAPVPGIDEVRAAATKAYGDADQLGVTYSQPAMGQLAQDATAAAKSAGIDPTLHPGASAALGRIQEAANGPVSLQEMDTLRQIVRDAGRSPADQRIAGILRDKLDGFIDTAGPGSAVSGDPTQAAEVLARARGNYAAASRAETVSDRVGRAELNTQSSGSGANADNALRQQFKGLYNNSREMRGFTPEEADAVRAVATGTPGQNFLRLLGKASPHHPLTAALTTGAAVHAGGPLGLLLPVVGEGAKRVADAMTKRAAERVQQMVLSRSPEAQDVAQAFLQSHQGVPALASPAMRAVLQTLLSRGASQL